MIRLQGIEGNFQLTRCQGIFLCYQYVTSISNLEKIDWLTIMIGSTFTLTGLSGLSFQNSVPILSSEMNSSYVGATSANGLFEIYDENSSIWNSESGTLKLIIRPGSALAKSTLYRSALIFIVIKSFEYK